MKGLEQYTTKEYVFFKIYERTVLSKADSAFVNMCEELAHITPYNTMTISDLRREVSRAIDALFDYGVVYGDWRRSTEAGVWLRMFFVDEDAMQLAHSMYSKYVDKVSHTLDDTQKALLDNVVSQESISMSADINNDNIGEYYRWNQLRNRGLVSVETDDTDSFHGFVVKPTILGRQVNDTMVEKSDNATETTLKTYSSR